MTIVRWFPGVTLEDLEKQVVDAALKFYPTQAMAANALGMDCKTIRKIKSKIEQEKEDEERGMDQFMATQNEAIRRIKAMAAAATVDQERSIYQETIHEDRKIENAIQRNGK